MSGEIADPVELVLASASPWRAAMLRDAGLTVRAETAGVDERAAEAPLAEADAEPEDIAIVLARLKAEDVSTRNAGDWVIGADQVLSLNGEVLHKVEDMDGARRRLLALSGRTHRLHSAVALAHRGETVWEHVATCSMTMRVLDPGFVGRHLAQAGENVLGSVGCYQIEGPGVQLFERIEGDLFSIVGLPLLPLLDELRTRSLIDG